VAIALVYRHKERVRAEKFCGPLRSEGFEFEHAPLGWGVGTKSWNATATRQLLEADAFFLLLTAKLLVDKSVGWRVGVALSTSTTSGASSKGAKTHAKGRLSAYIPHIFGSIAPICNSLTFQSLSAS